MSARFAAPTTASNPADEPLIASVWLYRVLPAMALLSLILAQTIFRRPTSHDACVGFAIGILLTLVVASVSLESVTFRRQKDRSDVEDLELTR